MTYVSVATPPLKSVEEFDALLNNLSGPPEGLQARYVGTCDGGLRVVAVWDSRQHAERFFTERLAPALAKTFGPETRLPQVDRIDVLREYTRTPV